LQEKSIEIKGVNPAELFGINNSKLKQIKSFFEDLFDLKKPFTKSDLDMLTDLYKSLDKNLKK
jgi:hypothetical protein